MLKAQKELAKGLVEGDIPGIPFHEFVSYQNQDTPNLRTSLSRWTLEVSKSP